MSGNRQMVTDVSPKAAAAGARAGMTLAQARSRCAALIHAPAAPADDLRSLESLARWLTRFSPLVAIAPPCSIFLDATGLELLFGPDHGVGRRVAEALGRLHLAAGVAMAPTPGAAWGLAAFGGSNLRIVDADDLSAALSPLPPHALRLETTTAHQLQSLGVSTIGLLLKIPRSELAARFGPAILERIDQATGRTHEPLNWLPYRSPIHAQIEFDGTIESLEAIHLTLRQLLDQFAEQLAGRGQGAKELRVIFRRPYAPPIEKTIQLTRPCRSAADLFNLLRYALEAVETDEGFIAVHLTATRTEPLGDEQAPLIGGEEERCAAEVDHLIERLRARLDHVLEWAQPVESHLPERAFRWTQGEENPDKPQRTQRSQRENNTEFNLNSLSFSVSVPSVSSVVKSFSPNAIGPTRPLCLLPVPRSLSVIVTPSESRDGRPVSFTDRNQMHRLAHIRGPERIAGEWWNGRWKTRDYFDAQDAAGNRYWFFRVAETGRWYLHGVFE